MAESRRIVMFMPTLAGGGAQRVMLDMARHLAESGEQVSLVVANDDGAYRDHLSESCELVVLGASRVALALVPFARWLRRNRPTAVVATLAHANILALLAVRLSGVRTRVILREANTPSFTARRSRKEAAVTALARLAYRRCDAVIAGSQGVAAELAESGVDPVRLHVLPNPISMPEIAEAAACDPGHPWLQGAEQVPVVVAAGRLYRQKAFDVLIDAVHRVRAERPVRLIILGEGNDRAALARRADELGIAADVDLPGFVSNPYSYMARAAVFVLSSRWEGLPNVLIQALACGAPCVSTDCPNGPAEILEHGEYGALVPVDDAAAMAQAIGRTLTANVDRERQRRRAWDFDITALLERWRAVIRPETATAQQRARRA